MKLPTIRLAFLACALALAGCASDPSRPRDREGEQRAAAFASSGYQSAESSSMTVAYQQWPLGPADVSLTLAFASSGSKLPLIIYLPGMGENAQAGARWRQAWAHAGYAVLSLQPLAYDADAWTSDLARNADFKALSHEHQQPALLPQRLAILRATLDEARRQAAAGDSLWARVDFNNMALAGYDLGTLTALALPGAKATLLLSPLPMDSATAASIAQPLLMVSSRRDQDLTGLIASPDARVQAFASLAPGNKSLLLLNDANHALLAGAAGSEETEERADEPAQRTRGQQGGQGGGGGRHQRGNSASTDSGGGQKHAAPRGQQPMSAASMMQAQAVETVSIAFWDAELRGRPEARHWLAQDAAPWLGHLAQWQQR